MNGEDPQVEPEAPPVRPNYWGRLAGAEARDHGSASGLAQEATRSPRYRRWGILLAWTVVVAGAAVAATLDRSALSQTLRALAHVRLGWLGLAIGAEILSVQAGAIGHRRLLAEAGADVPLRSVVAIAYAGAAVSSSLPFAGNQTAVAYSFRQYRKIGVDLAVAGWALVIAWTLTTLCFALILAIGAAVARSPVAAGAGLLTSVVFLIPPVAALVALRRPAVRQRIREWADAAVARIRHVTGRPRSDVVGLLDATLEQMAGLRIGARRATTVWFLYLACWAGDVGCFLAALYAVRAPVPWAAVLLAYGAGITAGSLGIVPGGLVLVEAAMTAALAAAGLHGGPALAAVLVYRLVSFWLVLGAGWVAMVLLARRPGVRDAVPAPAG